MQEARAEAIELMSPLANLVDTFIETKLCLVQEARAEAIELMSPLANLRTPKSGEVVICATQDFLTTAFLLTSKESFFTRPQFAQLCGFMDDACGHLDLPVRPIAPVTPDCFPGFRLSCHLRGLMDNACGPPRRARAPMYVCCEIARDLQLLVSDQIPSL